MRCIFSQTGDPFFNLAAEEFLLKHNEEAVYFQYVNDPAVVIGKHQNALAEIDDCYLQEQGIVLARRISGGGAVYHDSGNLNYSFITNELPGDFVKFRKYTAPAIAALRELGVDAFLGKRNEILTSSGKVSGSASHVFKTRVLHHGTLLFDADLERLGRCLYVDTVRYMDRAVKSVRSEVVNIRNLLETDMDREAFYSFIFRYIVASGENNVDDGFTRSEEEAIGALRQTKFASWEWNYGYSPKYTVEREMEGLRMVTTVEKGKIVDIGCEGSGLNELDTALLHRMLTGTQHD
ncbi:MAG: lipoate--protein ligase, partial [Bacteroidales bacterium]|nr:lipoate--protein ligase [Bacteroidales bacterium]